MQAKLLHPFTCMVAGPTGSGKSEFVKQVILNGAIEPMPVRIVWYYMEWQNGLAQQLPGVEFKQGLPEMQDFDGLVPTLVVLDDMMSEVNEKITALFTRGSHHRNLSVFFLTQNVFHKLTRDIALNSHYLVLFKNPRDKQQIATLARQMFPSDKHYLQDAYKQATEQPFGYLFLDMKQATPDWLRVRTNILAASPTFFFSRNDIRDGRIKDVVAPTSV
jgi:hypothetical protein